MKNKYHAILVALGCAFLGQVYAQDAKPALPEPPKVGAPKVEKPPGKPETTGRPEFVDAIKKIQDDFKQTRKDFLDQQKDLTKKLRNAAGDDRDKLRTEIKEKRQEFLDQQKEARQEAKQRVADLKDKLKDHREVLDDAKDKAKEAAKDKAKERKGGAG